MLAQNDLLVTIAQQLSERPILSEVVQGFRETELYKTGSYDDNNLPTYLSEIILRILLKKASAGLEDRIVFNPIPNGRRADGYTFRHLPFKGKLGIFLGDGTSYTEVDEVLLVDGLASVFEIRIANYYSKKRYSTGSKRRPWDRENRPRGSMGVKHALKMERINHLLRPFVTYFRSNCGYVFVIGKEQFRQDISTTQLEFARHGGILVPFYTDVRTYREIEVPRIRQEYGI